MAKLINILAASVGGGLVLGASIRLGEALASREYARDRHSAPPGSDGAPSSFHAGPGGLPTSRPGHRAEQNRVSRTIPVRDHPEPEGDPKPGSHAKPGNMLTRLERLEEKVSRIGPEEHAGSRSAEHGQANPASAGGVSEEWKAILADIGARIDRQQADMEAIRDQMSNAAHVLDSVGQATGSLRGDIHRQLSEDLDRRVAEIEHELHRSMEIAHQDNLDAMVKALETRVVSRISQLENDVTGQSTAVTELRECSLQTERSIQRLLVVLEKVVAPPANGARSNPFPTAPEQASANDVPGPAVVTSRRQDESAGGSGERGRRSFIFSS